MSKLISVVWYKVFPAEFGGQKGIAEFTQYLSLLVPIHVVCSHNNLWENEHFTGEKTLPTNKSQFFSKATYKTIEKAIAIQHGTHLLLEHPYYAWHGIRLAQKHRLNLIIHSHNIEFDRFRNLGKWWWPLLYLLERMAHKRAHLSLFKTAEDQRKAIRSFGLDPAKTMVAPFGIKYKQAPTLAQKAEARAFLINKHSIDPTHKILLFNGTLDYEPNATALKHVVDDIIPLLTTYSSAFTLIVTGRNEYPEFKWVKELKHANLLQVGYVEDVVPYFLGSDIFLNPVIKGGGIKVKLMESLANDLSVVSYTSGAVGVDRTVCGDKLNIVSDHDARSFAEAVALNWESKPQIPKAFYDTYHWEKIVKDVAERIDMLNY